ncbi:ribonuclease Z [Paenibacillaceae bacterium]|nr:ribonuclease Z [Paenibacillaceae bacterium]
MELTFLGTAAGRPMKGRNVSAVALQLSQSGQFWLFDCGEATQHQLLKTSLKLNKLDRIFITHMHGDHVFGLPGLLSTRSFLEGTGPLTLYGPPGIREYLEMALRLTGTNLNYELHIHEVADGTILDTDAYTVETALLDHRIASYGYRVTEKPKPGRLLVELLKELNVPSGPLYGQLKRGEDVVLEDGTIVAASQATAPPEQGRIITILGDTAPCRNAVVLARQADVLVHEATFSAELAEKAIKYGHSTTHHAAETAREAKARQLILTHFSTRYKEEELSELAAEARTIFEQTSAAVDLRNVTVTPPKQV